MPKRELCEEYEEELDRKLRQVRRNDVVTVVYFSRGEYLKVTGVVTGIDPTAGIMKVVNTKIPLGDIYDIEREE